MTYNPIPTIEPSGPLTDEGIKTASATLHKFIKGRHNDKQMLVEILLGYTNSQRQQIKEQYLSDYGHELHDDLKKALKGDFEELVLALLVTPIEYVCRHLNRALSGLTTNEKTLVELLVPRTNEEMRQVVALYEKMYDRPLVEHVCSCTSKYFRRLLTFIMMGHRDENSGQTDVAQARRLASELYTAREGSRGRYRTVFNRILSKENFAQLRLVFEEFEQLSGGVTIEEAASHDMSGDIYEGIIAIVECVRYMPGFFAGCLFRTMKGWVTDNAALTRVIVSRSEIDLVNIKQSFQRIYNRDLISCVKTETSGDYRKALLMLLKEEPND